jgi:hypothetical protein
LNYAYLRINHTGILQTKSGSLFKNIFVISAIDGVTQLVILVGHQGEQTKLYDDVSMALKAMQDPLPVENIWLPQFTYD